MSFLKKFTEQFWVVLIVMATMFPAMLVGEKLKSSAIITATNDIIKITMSAYWGATRMGKFRNKDEEDEGKPKEKKKSNRII